MKTKLSSYAYTLALLALMISACNQPFKNDYTDNSPTSGKLKVYYDESLELHARNQALTFESQYPNAQLQLVGVSENDAIQALYKDSCQSIMIERQLNANEKKAFESKGFYPKYSAVAISGIAIITNSATPLSQISYDAVLSLLRQSSATTDSAGNSISLNVLLDKSNSSVAHYLSDSLLKGGKFSANCNSLASGLDCINYVAKNKNTLALIDFAWLSDEDDSIYKANEGVIRILRINKPNTNVYEYPSQSSFKLGTYPFARTVYVYRKTGDFTLAKGFESFVAGPKGQLTFLKQGLLPTRQNERRLHINTKPLNE